MNDTNSLAHTKWNCKYHIVFAPKYRRKVFFGEKRREIGKILRQLCEWKKVNIVEAEVCPDHIHIPNLYLPDEPDYQIGKYGRMRRSYLKAHRPVLYANYLTSGTLHQHLAEIDQACNERMEIIVSAMAKQEGVTEALKAADQMEWVRRMNNIRSRAEEIVLTELVYE